MLQFHDTVIGQRFLMGTVPSLVKQLEKLNENLEDLNLLKTVEAERAEAEKATAMPEKEEVRTSYWPFGMHAIKFDGVDYDEQFILNHMGEFEDALREGISPYDFERHCTMSDAVGHYIDSDDYRGIYQILMRIYDDDDQVDEMLLNPTPELDKLIHERYEEEIVGK